MKPSEYDFLKIDKKWSQLLPNHFYVSVDEQEIDVNENTLECMSNFLCCRDGRVLSVKYTSEKRATEDTKDSFLNIFVSSNVFN